MKIWHLLFIVLASVLLMSMISVWFVPSIKDFMAGNSEWNGIKNSLKYINGNFTTSLNILPKSPEESVLISVPYLEYSQSDLLKIKEYVVGGGTLLLADDFGFGNQVLEYLSVATRFDGRSLLDPLFCYHDPQFPKITDFPFQVQNLTGPLSYFPPPEVPKSDVLVSSSVNKSKIHLVILNHATLLVNVPDQDVLAESSPTSFVDSDGNGVQGSSEQASPYPVGAKIPFGKGLLVLISDPSIFINSMINRDDNLEFINLIINPDNTKNVLFDASHLSETPLDMGKNGLGKIRNFFTEPYPALAIIGISLISVSWIVLRRGGLIGRQL